MVTTTDLAARVEATAGAVPDPELPEVTLEMLGVVHDVAVASGHARVTLLPTFAGCPALDMIERDVRAAVAGIDEVERVTVRFVHEPAWTPDRISPEGREALRRFGIAPPVTTPGVVEGGTRHLPVLEAPRPSSGRTCPWCGSTATSRDGLFGPTPCRDVWFCTSCSQPFEGFKS